ncbi:MAG: glycosyltransferase family 4 protein [bacterium]
MKILHIITRLDRGGSADNTLLSCIGQRRRGHEVTLMSGTGTTEDSPLKDTAGEEGVKLVLLPSLVRAISPLRDLKALWSCCRIIRSGKYDVIHTHTSKAGILGRLAARISGGCRVVHTPHGHVFYGYFGRLKTKVFIRAERIMARWTDAIVTLTDHEAEEHLENGIGRREQFVTVFSGIPMKNAPGPESGRNKSSLRFALGLPHEGPLIVSVGRLEPIKDHGTLIEAFARVTQKYPGAHLVLAGEGELAATHETLADNLGLRGRISFLGWRNDVGELLEAADLFVLPSINEGMGRAVVEAMRAGLAVVATNVGGVPAIVEDGVTGLLVPPGDPASLTAAIKRLISHPALRVAMGEAGRLKASEFSDEAMIHQLESVYQRALSPPPFAEVSA